MSEAEFELEKNAAEEERSVFLEQTADHWRMLIPVSGRYNWNRVTLKKSKDAIESDMKLKVVTANLEAERSKNTAITVELEQAKKEIEKLKACLML